MEDNGLEFRTYWRIFLKWWWVLALGTVTAGLAAFFISDAMTPGYQAKTRLLVQGGQSSGAPFLSEVEPATGAGKYRDLIKTRPILERVIQELSLPYESDILFEKISVSSPGSLLEIRVNDPDPQLAADIANATAGVFINDFRTRQFGQIAQFKASLSQQGIVEGIVEDPRAIAAQAAIIAAQAATLSTLSIVEEAVPPPFPVSPRIKLNIILAAAVGLIISGLVVLLIQYLDDGIRSPEELKALTLMPNLGSVVRYRAHGKLGPIILDEQQRLSPFAESYKFLGTSLEWAASGTPGLRTLLVTSSRPGEGKTTTAVNLAISRAGDGKSVILVDGDFRRPDLHRIFEFDDSLGLTQILAGSLPVETALNKTRVEGLRVIASGPPAPNVTHISQILRSPKMKEIVEQLKGMADLVIFDSAPVLSVTDPMLMAPLLDGVLLVVAAHGTGREVVKRAAEALQQVHMSVSGTVLNNMAPNDLKRFYYYYPHYPANERSWPNGKSGFLSKVLTMGRRAKDSKGRRSK